MFLIVIFLVGIFIIVMLHKYASQETQQRIEDGQVCRFLYHNYGPDLHLRYIEGDNMEYSDVQHFSTYSNSNSTSGQLIGAGLCRFLDVGQSSEWFISGSINSSRNTDRILA
jgi:hypothetical protein